MSADRSRSKKKNAKADQNETKKKNRRLHEQLDENHLNAIHAAFENANGKSMDQRQLRELLYDVALVTFEDAEFDTLFLQINSGR